MTHASTTSDLELLVVVINYRTAGLTLECLASVAPEVSDFEPGGIRVIVVDNDSRDGSYERLHIGIVRNGWSDWATVAPAPTNLGFAGGNNYGLRLGGRAEFVLFLNSDAFTDRGCLRHCVDSMRRRPSVGALSCRVLNEDRTIQNVARRFPSPGRLLAASLGLPYRWPTKFGWADIEDPGWDRTTQTRSVDWLGGAFLMVRTEVLEKVGAWDEDFFFYGEDIELCHRIRRAGYRCQYDHAVTAVHLGGASSGPDLIPRTDRDRHRWTARYLVQRKLYGRGAVLFLRALDALLWTARWVRCAFVRRDPKRAADAAAVVSLVLGKRGGAL